MSELLYPKLEIGVGLVGVEGVVSVAVYGSYGILANMEKKDSDWYLNKKREYESRRSTQISVIPLIDPVEQKYGGILALNF